MVLCKIYAYMRGHAAVSQLRHYATSRMVVGSIPDDVIAFFNLPNPSSHTVALGPTQPLTEMSRTGIA
jgi:hypothetical protein